MSTTEINRLAVEAIAATERTAEAQEIADLAQKNADDVYQPGTDARDGLAQEIADLAQKNADKCFRFAADARVRSIEFTKTLVDDELVNVYTNFCYFCNKSTRYAYGHCLSCYTSYASSNKPTKMTEALASNESKGDAPCRFCNKPTNVYDGPICIDTAVLIRIQGLMHSTDIGKPLIDCRFDKPNGVITA